MWISIIKLKCSCSSQQDITNIDHVNSLTSQPQCQLSAYALSGGKETEGKKTDAKTIGYWPCHVITTFPESSDTLFTSSPSIHPPVHLLPPHTGSDGHNQNSSLLTHLYPHNTRYEKLTLIRNANHFLISDSWKKRIRVKTFRSEGSS